MSRPIGPILDIALSGSCQAFYPPRERVLVRIRVRDGARRRGHGAHRSLHDGLPVGIDGQHRLAGRTVRDQQIIEIEHRADIGLRGPAQRMQGMNTGGYRRGAGVSGRLLDLGIEGRHDLVITDANHVAIADGVAFGSAAREGLRLIVYEHAVRAHVLQVEPAVAIFDPRVVSRNVTKRIRQDPVVIRRAADSAPIDRKDDTAAVPERPPLITDDAQAKRHGSPNKSRFNPIKGFRSVRAASPARADI